MRNRTVPGKYTIGSWQTVAAGNAQETLKEQVIATQHLMVVRCTYPAGSVFDGHTHSQEQITIVEQGELEFEIAGEWLARTCTSSGAP